MKKKRPSVKKQKVDRSRKQNLRKRIERGIARKAAERTTPTKFPKPSEIEQELNKLTVVSNCRVFKNNSTLSIHLLVNGGVSDGKVLNSVKTCLLIRFNFPLDEKVIFKVAKVSK